MKSEAASWQTTPDSVRKRVRDLESDRHTAQQLAALLKRDGIDALHASGELRTLVGRLAPEEGASGVSLLEALPMRVPLINKVTAGYPADFTDLGYPARIADEYVSVPGIEDPDAFAARVVGDSMTPQYCEGDIVVFSPLRDTASGSDCFVRFDESVGGESTFKRVYFEEDAQSRAMIRLQPINPEYPPRSVRREDVAGLYAAVYVVRRVGG